MGDRVNTRREKWGNVGEPSGRGPFIRDDFIMKIDTHLIEMFS